MKIRVLVLSVILILAIAVAASAQPAPGATAPNQPVIAKKVIQQLGLNREQVQKIHAIVLKYRQDVSAVLKSNASKDEKEAQIKDLRVKAAAAINAVLTPEQKVKAQKMRLIEVLLAPRPVRAEAKLLAMVWKLDLSDAQKTTIKGIVTEFEAAAKAIRADTSLQPAEKSKKLAELRKAMNQKVFAALTPAQQAKLKEMMKNRGPAK